MNKYMKLAIEEAKLGVDNNEGGPFGAVIVKGDKVISKAHNQVLAENDPTMHAEIAAIRLASKALETYDLSGCEIYSTGEPCPMCLSAIMWANIGKVYYGCNIEDTENIGFRDNKFYKDMRINKKDWVVELDRDECLKLYQYYNDKKDRTIY